MWLFLNVISQFIGIFSYLEGESMGLLGERVLHIWLSHPAKDFFLFIWDNKEELEQGTWVAQSIKPLLLA